jgi:hypothetical protein
MSCIPAVYTCCVVKKTIDMCICMYVNSCHVVHTRGVRTHELQHAC